MQTSFSSRLCLAVLFVLSFVAVATVHALETSWTDWTEDGFSLRHPQGWQAKTDGRGAVAVTGTNGESLIVWPMFGPTRIHRELAASLLEKITGQLEPGVRLERVQETISGAVRSQGTRQGRELIAVMTVASTPRGDAATYVLTSAPQGTLAGLAPIFAEIMNSIELRGNSGTSMVKGLAAGEIAYTSFTDPTEGGFTADVPARWRVEGGIARFNAADVRPWIRLMSQDGRIMVMMGDPQIPSMLVPNGPLAAMGFTEGMIYDAGYNQRFLLRSYYPGKQAARLYAENSLANNCRDAAVEDFRDRPELSAAINGIFRRYGSPFAQQELQTGEISRSCPGSGRAQYVFAGTLLSQMPSYQGIFAMWVVNYLYAFDAPREEAATALAVTRRLADSFQVTAEWARMNGGLQSRVSEIVAEAGAAIAQSASQGYWNAQKAMGKSFKRYGQSVLGVEDAVDPLTGQEIEIVSGANHAWIDHRGYVVGTDTDTSPGVDYRQLFLPDR